MPKSLHKSLYHALFESHLIYGISVWGSQSHTVLHELFTIQKNCVRTIFGNEHAISTNNLYCYCNYGDSGVMICCEKCDCWFHDECLGLTEAEVLNIAEYYCIECLNRDSNISVKYIIPPQTIMGDTYCYCHEGESGFMVECGKCKNWFHDICINLSQSELNQILIYFCPSCLTNNSSLKIIHKDYSKEHTKPIFKDNDILTIYNLFPYHSLLELYKILKFRIPYCMYELFIFCLRHSGSNLLI